MTSINSLGSRMPSIHDDFQAAAVPKFQDLALKAGLGTRIGHAISDAFSSFGRGIGNLFSRAADVFVGKEARAERQANRLLAAYDRKLSGLIDGMATGKLGGEDALRGFQQLANMEQKLEALSPQRGTRVSMVMTRTTALLDKLEQTSPQTVQALKDAINLREDGSHKMKSDTVREGMEKTYVDSHAALTNLADLFDEERPPPLDLASDQHLERAVGRFNDVLSTIRGHGQT